LPKGKDGWLLFLDEFPSASRAVQAAAYKLTLDRMVGEHKLHSKVKIVCAGNLETDGAIVNPMSTANQSRLIHMQLSVSNPDWLEWAAKKGIDHRITSYIRYRPEVLHKFDPDHADTTFACPRTWEFVHKLLTVFPDEIPTNRVQLLGGAVSDGVAKEFYQFTKVYKDLPSIEELKNTPLTAKLPTDRGTLFAMAGVLANHVEKECSDAFMQYAGRMPAEYQVVTIREMCIRFPQIEMNTMFQEKLSELAQRL
jgi:hypothetical protein